MRIYALKRYAAPAALVVAMALATYSQAGTLTWNQTTGGSWQSTGWSGSSWLDGSDAIFNEPNTITVTVDAPVAANSLTWTAGKVTIGGTSALSLGAGGLSMPITPASTAISAPLNLTASQTWTNSSGTAFVVSGKTDFGTSGQTLTLFGNNASASVNFKFSTGANTGAGTIAIGGTGSTAVTLQVGNTASSPFGSGTLSLRKNGRISSDSATAARTIANALSLDDDANVGGQANVGALTFNGAFTVNGTHTLTSDAGASAAQSVTFAGATTLKRNLTVATKPLNTTIFKGAIGDDGTSRTLTKSSIGSGGLLQLAGHNTYGGATIVNGGTLQLDGGSLANANITIASGATFNATANGGSITYNLANDTSDLIANAGSLDLTGINLLVNASGVQTMDEYVVASINAGLTGQFASTSLPSGWSLDYDGTAEHPNDVVLVALVPEPGSLALLVIGALGFLSMRRHRQG